MSRMISFGRDEISFKFSKPEAVSVHRIFLQRIGYSYWGLIEKEKSPIIHN
jgi:hypothetical protein